jgi:hypothetical protein
MIIHLATTGTRHYEFKAAAKTKRGAAEALLRAVMAHCDGNPDADRDYMFSAFEGATYTTLELGAGYCDDYCISQPVAPESEVATSTRAILHQHRHLEKHGWYDPKVIMPCEDESFSAWIANVLECASLTDAHKAGR